MALILSAPPHPNIWLREPMTIAQIRSRWSSSPLFCQDKVGLQQLLPTPPPFRGVPPRVSRLLLHHLASASPLRPGARRQTPAHPVVQCFDEQPGAEVLSLLRSLGRRLLRKPAYSEVRLLLSTPPARRRTARGRAHPGSPPPSDGRRDVPSRSALVTPRVLSSPRSKDPPCYSVNCRHVFFSVSRASTPLAQAPHRPSAPKGHRK